MGKLTAKAVQEAKLLSGRPTTLSDGDGLTLVLRPGEDGEVRKNWIFRYSPPRGKLKVSASGKQYKVIRELGLGSARTVSLKDARELSRRARLLVMQGIDPIEERRDRQQEVAAPKVKVPTCDAAMLDYVRLFERSWTPGHTTRFVRGWQQHIGPHIGSLLVSQVTTDMAFEILKPLWWDHFPTADKMRSQGEVVLNFGGVNAFTNPFRWRGNLEYRLGRPSKVHKTQNHPAMPAADVPRFVAELHRVQPSFYRRSSPYRPLAAKCLIYTVLLAKRASETADMVWSELDMSSAGWVWTLPAERSKTRKTHVIPLPRQAQALLEGLRGQDGTWVFPFNRSLDCRRQTLSEINRMFKVPSVPHGFRSTFSDWVTDNDICSAEVRELCLGHTIGTKVSRAYLRTEQIEQQRDAFQAWADYCCSHEGEVDVPMLRSMHQQRIDKERAAKGLPPRLLPGEIVLPNLRAGEV
jgi:integrase